jgi:predicted phage terminase large subunit-like protein
VPTPKQSQFLRCTADEALYAGEAAGGKTWSLLVAALRWVHYPKFRGIIFRRTVPELKDHVIPEGKELYTIPAGGPDAYNETDRVWRFPSGAIIKFGAMQLFRDRQKYDSSQWHFCAYDELTTFEEEEFYTYLFTRLRSTDKRIPTRMRAATNPGGPGAHWVQKRWEPWLGDPDDEDSEPWAKPGQWLSFLKTGDAHLEEIVPHGTPESKSRTFFGSKLEDNPHIDQEEYKANLRATDLLTYEQKGKGNWMARPKPGMFFRRDFWPDTEERTMFLPAGFVAPDAIERVRYWDLAATADDKDDGVSDKGPDWTSGVRMCKRRDESLVVEDVARDRIAESDVEGYILATAEADADECGVGNVTHIIEQEPGASGKIAAGALVLALAQAGHSARKVRPTGNKIDRAKPMAAQARSYNIYLVRGPWNRRFIAEAEMFPKGKKDQIDGLSGCGAELAKVRVPKGARTGGRRPAIAAQGGF